MLGTFRLILALLVALSHANVRIAGFNWGVVAVVCFYLISGYVMTGLLRQHYPGLQHVPRFYLDRVLRIFPHYLAIAGSTLIWFFVADPRTSFLQYAPQASDLLANLTVVPLNYFMFNETDRFTLVPPAWSLGTEIQFYLLIPLLLWWRLRSIAFLLGAVVFGAAATGLLHTDTFGYRLLPGVLIFFLLGSALYDTRHDPRRALRMIAAGLMVAGGTAVLLHTYARLALPYNRETLLGVAIGLPVLYWLAPLRPSRWDTWLGDISYGVFLNHFFIQWIVGRVPSGVWEWATYLVASVLLSVAMQYWIERPILRWRRRLRAPSETGDNRQSGQSV